MMANGWTQKTSFSVHHTVFNNAHLYLQLPLLLLLCFFLFQLTTPLHAEEIVLEDLLEALRADDIPGNASRALRKLDPRWGKDNKDRLQETRESLKALTTDPDPQIRQFALYLLVLAEPKMLAPESPARLDILKTFSHNFAADNISHNATHAFRIFLHRIRKNDAEDIRELLIPLLNDPNYQARQIATWLLVMSCRESAIPETEWHPLAFKNMVEGLRDDGIRYHRGTIITNASDFFIFLYELNTCQPVDLLRKELKGGDIQSQYAAALLLARYGDLESGPAIRNIILPHLIDDNGYSRCGYALAAYPALIWLGRNHSIEMLHDFQTTDWQESALLVCTAAFHGITPSFVNDTHRETWLSNIWAYESADPELRYREHLNAKISAAALYLDPGAASFLMDKNHPPYLQRMFAAGRTLSGSIERASWMATWFPMLAPSPYRASFSIAMGYAERPPENLKN